MEIETKLNCYHECMNNFTMTYIQLYLRLKRISKTEQANGCSLENCEKKNKRLGEFNCFQNYGENINKIHSNHKICAKLCSHEVSYEWSNMF